MPIEMTEQDLALLNPAERAIMEADDEDDENELAALADDGDDEGDKSPAAKAVPAVKADNSPNDDGDDDGDQTLIFTAKTPADAVQLRLDNETRKEESFAKLMAGEIDPEEYQKVAKEVDAELFKLMQASITDAVTSELTQAQIQKVWNTEVRTSLKSAAAEGFDYKANDDLGKEWDGLVKIYGSEAQQRGMNDDGLKASKWALEEAHRTMKARHPELVIATPGAKPGAVRERARADLGTIPPNLRGAPVAASTSVGSEFSHMDGLTGAASEKAFARLTPEQQERWLDT